ncbi:hypothetical protein TNCV_4845881 [Trichonephila clavipes]|uniref:Uncharacterized protein n=1 Tax=Trichonephila clavipes TaxID=2585209 RepID=A0A8X6WLH1_TRICX|nr:hypothetical protein TNCV_4845881 [Trichonephila clavipes]
MATPPPQFRHGTGGEGKILQTPAPAVSAATTHKTFGPTDLTGTYSVCTRRRAVGSLVVRASDSRPEGLGSMPDATKHHPSTHGFTCSNCGGGDRGRVAIYRPFGELRRAKIVLSPVWCSRPTSGVPLAHATMNFVGLDLTTSDRYVKGSQTYMRRTEVLQAQCVCRTDGSVIAGSSAARAMKSVIW